MWNVHDWEISLIKGVKEKYLNAYLMWINLFDTKCVTFLSTCLIHVIIYE